MRQYQIIDTISDIIVSITGPIMCLITELKVQMTSSNTK